MTPLKKLAGANVMRNISLSLVFGLLSCTAFGQAQPARIKAGFNYSTVTDFSGDTGNSLQLGF